jgi:hypothetical protein
MRLRSVTGWAQERRCDMGERSMRQTTRRAALAAQAGQRQEQVRRLDALAVEVLVALGERDAAERRAVNCCRPWSTVNSCRCGRRSPGSATRSRSAARHVWLHSRFRRRRLTGGENASAGVGRRVDQDGSSALADAWCQSVPVEGGEGSGLRKPSRSHRFGQVPLTPEF